MGDVSLPKLHDGKKEPEKMLRRSLSPKSIVAGMLRSKETCFTKSPAIVKIQNDLMKEERRRKAQRTRIISD